ncbi:unnamed protein product [Linum tenue]|uniref:Uncharacterized protein n=1 Tax=Linum tenue TaxID=586396 RepID=A0AAV0HIN7_9ROSI|nr:unnamed protein product [Linum tenue]
MRELPNTLPLRKTENSRHRFANTRIINPEEAYFQASLAAARELGAGEYFNAGLTGSLRVPPQSLFSPSLRFAGGSIRQVGNIYKPEYPVQA